MRTLTSAAAALATVFLVGCGGSDDPDQTTRAAAEPSPQSVEDPNANALATPVQDENAIVAVAQAERPETRADDAPAYWRDEISVLRVSLNTQAEANAGRVAMVEVMERYLEEATGLPIRFYRVSDYNSVIQALASGQLDVATMGAGAYANVYDQIGDEVVPILAARGAQGERGYYSAAIVRADSDFQSLEDLEGAAIAYVDRSSTSGYIFPRHILRENGIEPDEFFGDAVISGGHSESVIALLNGQFDAAIVMVGGGTPDTGFMIGAHTMLADRGLIDANDVREIWYAGPIPNSPYVVRADRPQAFIDLLRGAIAALPYEHPDVWEMFGLPPGMSLFAVEHEFYEPIVAMRNEEIATRRGRGDN